jgi:hypothetical protein
MCQNARKSEKKSPEKSWNKIKCKRNSDIETCKLIENKVKKMTNNSGNNNHKNGIEERENKKLKRLLQKACNAEKAPESLRVKISQMIREK